MPYLTLTEKSKATTKPWFSRLLQHPAGKRSASIMGHTHMLTYLLAPDSQWALEMKDVPWVTSLLYSAVAG